MHACMHTYIHTYIPRDRVAVRVRFCTFATPLKHDLAVVCVDLYAYSQCPVLHAYIHTFIHTYIHTYIHTLLHTFHTLHYITLHYITLPYLTLRYVTLRYVTLRYVTLRYVTLHYITSHHITLHYITLHYITLHYITLHYITLHYITLHYITLHYITLHYITLHTYIHTYIHIYVYTYIYTYMYSHAGGDELAPLPVQIDTEYDACCPRMPIFLRFALSACRLRPSDIALTLFMMARLHLLARKQGTYEGHWWEPSRPLCGPHFPNKA